MRRVASEPAKVGTQPWQIIVDGHSKKRAVGSRIRFRRAGSGEKWVFGQITAINPDGMLFIDLFSSAEPIP